MINRGCAVCMALRIQPTLGVQKMLHALPWPLQPVWPERLIKSSRSSTAHRSQGFTDFVCVQRCMRAHFIACTRVGGASVCTRSVFTDMRDAQRAQTDGRHCACLAASASAPPKAVMITTASGGRLELAASDEYRKHPVILVRPHCQARVLVAPANRMLTPLAGQPWCTNRDHVRRRATTQSHSTAGSSNGFTAAVAGTSAGSPQLNLDPSASCCFESCRCRETGGARPWPQRQAVKLRRLHRGSRVHSRLCATRVGVAARACCARRRALPASGGLNIARLRFLGT